jgi:hypothetical protein
VTNHLGNVMTTVTDFRTAIPAAGNSALTGYYKSDIASAVEYYPFSMASRGVYTDGMYYRFGFKSCVSPKINPYS